MQGMLETQVPSLGWEDALEEEMATHSRILAWEIPGRRSLAGCSPQGLKESDMTEQLHFLSIIYYKEGMATHSNILAWRIPMDRGAWQAMVHTSQRVGHD